MQNVIQKHVQQENDGAIFGIDISRSFVKAKFCVRIKETGAERNLNLIKRVYIEKILECKKLLTNIVKLLCLAFYQNLIVKYLMSED